MIKVKDLTKNADAWAETFPPDKNDLGNKAVKTAVV